MVVGEGDLEQCTTQDTMRLDEAGGHRVVLTLKLLQLTGNDPSGNVGVGVSVTDDLLGLGTGLCQSPLRLANGLFLTLAGLGVGAGTGLLGPGQRPLQALLGPLGLSLGLPPHLPGAPTCGLMGVGALLDGLLMCRSGL